MSKQKIEGYWKEKDHVIRLESKVKPGIFVERVRPSKSNYPTPIPNVLTENEAKSIYDLIVKKQNTAKKDYYMGFSTSRITGEMLGSGEYYTDEWRWPGDFAEHYVLKHRVKPTDDFLKYIGYE